MASTNREMVEGYELLVQKIDAFTVEHTFVEPDLKACLRLLADIREDCVQNYNDGADDLGWNVSID